VGTSHGQGFSRPLHCGRVPSHAPPLNQMVRKKTHLYIV
jgi:hypothetical protein